MDHVLPHLIESARIARDRQAQQLTQAQQAVQQAHATLQRLDQFRAEYLGRSAASTGAPTHRQALEQYQRFVGRLDEALVLQRQELGARQAQADAQQQELVKAQQRMLAFETLAKRRAGERERKAMKLQQHQSDEFAARAARRTADGPLP